MNINRAVGSFLVAALMPGMIAILTTPVESSNFLTAVVVFGVWYVVSLPLIFIIGFVTLFFSLKIRYGPFFLPPLAGCLSGIVFAKLMYVRGTPVHDMWLLVLDGLLTAIVAALIYFKPWLKLRHRY
jgi:hypothetical protein